MDGNMITSPGACVNMSLFVNTVARLEKAVESKRLFQAESR